LTSNNNNWVLKETHHECKNVPKRRTKENPTPKIKIGIKPKSGAKRKQGRSDKE
jgi:hypothetical protein